MVRRTWAPSLVWFCTCHRKMSPTLMCTMSRPPQSSPAWVPLPLPWTPMITYLRIVPPSVGGADADRTRGGSPGECARVNVPGIGHFEHVVLGDQHSGLLVEARRQPGRT